MRFVGTLYMLNTCFFFTQVNVFDDGISNAFYSNL